MDKMNEAMDGIDAMATIIVGFKNRLIQEGFSPENAETLTVAAFVQGFENPDA